MGESAQGEMSRPTSLEFYERHGGKYCRETGQDHDLPGQVLDLKEG